MTNEHKRKISEALSGKKRTKEQCLRISKAKLGHRVSMETRKKISDGHKGLTPWNKGKTGITKAWNKGLNGYNSGENHWNWKGGISTHLRRLRNSLKWKEWREAIFNRDNYTCLSCGKRGIEIHPHHIDSFAKYPEFRFDISNGITLCKKCHYSLHTK